MTKENKERLDSLLKDKKNIESNISKLEVEISMLRENINNNLDELKGILAEMPNIDMSFNSIEDLNDDTIKNILKFLDDKLTHMLSEYDNLKEEYLNVK